MLRNLFIIAAYTTGRNKVKIYFPLLFALMAFFFLFIGIKVVLSKRPLFMSSRCFFAILVLAFSPQFINAANLLSKDLPSNFTIIIYLSPIMFVCLLVFCWFQMKGYMAIGVSEESFREALHFSLNKNNLPFDEKLSFINLTSINARLQIAIQSWIGAGQLKIKKSKDSKILSEIVKGINEYYIENNIRPNNVTSIFYILMGVFMLVFAVAMYYIFP